MSTFAEIEKTCQRFRKPYWNDRAYLEIISPGGFWLRLYDPMSQVANGWPCPQNVSVLQVDDGEDDWEPYYGKQYEI